MTGVGGGSGPDTASGPGRRTPTLRRDAVLVACGQLLAVASGFLLTVVGARVLSREDFGSLSWTLSWVTYLAVVAQVGLTSVATVGLAGPADPAHPTVARRVLAAQVVGLLPVVAAWWLLLGPAAASLGEPPEAYHPLVAPAALWLPAAAVGPVVVNALRARGRFGLSLAFGEHVRRLLLIGLLVSAAASLELPALVATAVALETVVYLLAVLVLLRVVGRPVRDVGDDHAPSTGALLRLGSGFSLATLASVTVPQAGVWLLAALAPVDEVAVFAVAVRLALLVGTPTAVVMRALAPRVVAAHRAGDVAGLQESVRRAALASALVTTAAVTALAAGGSPLLSAVFGPGYGDALLPALVLCTGVLVNAWTGPCSVVLSHAGHQRTVAVSALLSAVAFGLLGLWWGREAGGLGVAAAAAVAMSARNLHLAGAVHRSVGVRTIATLPPRRRSR